MSEPISMIANQDSPLGALDSDADEAELSFSEMRFGNHWTDPFSDELRLERGAMDWQSENVDGDHIDELIVQKALIAHKEILVTKLLITVSEAGRVLAISRSKVYELMEAGYIPSVCIGRSRRIRVSDLEAFVDSVER